MFWRKKKKEPRRIVEPYGSTLRDQIISNKTLALAGIAVLEEMLNSFEREVIAEHAAEFQRMVEKIYSIKDDNLETQFNHMEDKLLIVKIRLDKLV